MISSTVLVLIVVLLALAVVYALVTGRKLTSRGVLELVLAAAIVVVLVLLVLSVT